MGPEAISELIKKYMPRAKLLELYAKNDYKDRLVITRVTIEYKGNQRQSSGKSGN